MINSSFFNCGHGLLMRKDYFLKKYSTLTSPMLKISIALPAKQEPTTYSMFLRLSIKAQQSVNMVENRISQGFMVVTSL